MFPLFPYLCLVWSDWPCCVGYATLAYTHRHNPGVAAGYVLLLAGHILSRMESQGQRR